MALMPLAGALPGLGNLQNLFKDGRLGSLLPESARGVSNPAAATAVGNGSKSTGDSLELTGTRDKSSANGRLVLDGSGIYRLLQASSFQASASRSWTSTGSGSNSLLGKAGTANDVRAAGSDSSLMGRLRDSLTKLGLSDQDAQDLMAVAGMLEKLDPEAFKSFVSSMESFADKFSPASALQAGNVAQAAGAGQGGAAAGYSLNYVSLHVSFSEVTAKTTQDENGTTTEISARTFDLSFERLQISMSQQGGDPAQLQQGDPIVLDIAGNGTNLRTTSDGALFDLAGTGRAVRTAFVQGDDALLFYDANKNNQLDDGKELVGNRKSGVDGMQELGDMDSDGDGWVTPFDVDWSNLKLFQAADDDGQSVPGAVKLLEELGITGLSTLWDRTTSQDGEGLFRTGTSSFSRADGTSGLMLDYYFGYRPADEAGEKSA